MINTIKSTRDMGDSIETTRPLYDTMSMRDTTDTRDTRDSRGSD